MALSKAYVREILTEAGVDAEKMSSAVNKIITGNVESIEAMREEVSALRDDVKKYKADAEKLPDVQKELRTLKAEAEKNKDKDYDALRQEFDDYKAGIAAKEAKAQKEKLYREALKDADLSDTGIEKAVKYADWDGIEVDDKGALKDAKGLIKSAKEEWAAYVVTKRTEGARTQTPPENNGGGKPEMSAAAKMARQYYAEHYGAATQSE